MVKAVRHLTESTVRLVTRIRQNPVQAGVPFTAPRLPFNTSITPHRQVAFASAPLADVEIARDAFGVTINDVVLAVVAGAMRRYLEDRGELPDTPLVAVIPTSVRSVDEKGNMGNRVSAMFTRLATELDDPVERLFAVKEVMSGAKLVHRDIGGETLEEWAEFLAPSVLSGGARLYGRLRLAERMPPIYNLVVSNVPGPKFPLYIAGSRLVGMYPMGPIFDGAGLNVTVLSYLDAIDIGLMACREMVPELWNLADAFPGALADLVKAAEAA
jgi:WS/DGAT/MGAT family acyltransferase